MNPKEYYDSQINCDLCGGPAAFCHDIMIPSEDIICVGCAAKEGLI